MKAPKSGMSLRKAKKLEPTKPLTTIMKTKHDTVKNSISNIR